MKKEEKVVIENKQEQIATAETNYDCPSDGYVVLKDVNKVYDNGFHAVHDFNLDIQKHEFIVFVGPSGCGKSTSLRMIAGLEDISSGGLWIDGEYVNDLSPRDRNIAMVFQSYALYPHMTVFNNMAYSLKIRKFDIRGLTPSEKAKYEKELNALKAKVDAATGDEKAALEKQYQERVLQINELADKIRTRHLTHKEIYDKVMDAARILQIEEYLDRKPKALSGGQRQRVALGRAIVRNAKVFLMDEPLSNLDAKLRVQMRSEIVSLHNKINATTIYVTHDQTEAMTMASRIVIMKDGYVQQIGTPIEIFNHPANKFVASFIGSPAMNFFEVTYKNGAIKFKNGVEMKIPEKYIGNRKLQPKMILGIRPEHILDANDKNAAEFKDVAIEVDVELTELLGSEYYVHNDFKRLKFISKQEALSEIKPGTKAKVCFNLNKLHFFDPETEEVIK